MTSQQYRTHSDDREERRQDSYQTYESQKSSEESFNSSYGAQVTAFDINSIFIDEDVYQKQIDIYSDQLVAIEAIRLELLHLQGKLDILEDTLGVVNDEDIFCKQQEVHNQM